MDHGLYGPGSMAWRLARERALLLAGPRAILMQVAHPQVAAGVAAHSDFRHHPIRRLLRTMRLSLAGVFGDTAAARAAAADINRVHRQVRGPGYDATDPALLAWVAATLVDSSLVAYELFVGPLTEEDRQRYYAESRHAARLLRLPPAALPADVAGLRAYMAAMLEGEVRVSAEGRAVGLDTLYPPRAWWAPRPLLNLMALITAGLLPPTLREQYGLPWSIRRRAAFDVAARLVRAGLPLLPPLLRDVPEARAAERRLRGRV